MAYGTDAFTDRYGDYKQPTVIDYDKELAINQGVTNSIPEESAKNIADHNEDKESILKEVLSLNPLFAGERYKDFYQAVNQKLVWKEDKIKEMSSDSDWLFNLRKYLTKAKKNFFQNKNPKGL